MCHTLVTNSFSHILNRCPAITHGCHERLEYRCIVKGIILCLNKRIGCNIFFFQKFCITWNHGSHLVVCSLCITSTQINGKRNCLFHIFTMRINSDCLWTSVCKHLLFLSVNCISWKRCNSHVISKCFFNRICIPRSGKHCLYTAITKSCKSRSVCINYKIGICCQINCIIGCLYCLFSCKINSFWLVCSISKQGASISQIECRKIPWISKWEGYCSFLQHRIQIFHIFFWKHWLIIKHIPGIGCKRNPVKLSVNL